MFVCFDLEFSPSQAQEAALERQGGTNVLVLRLDSSISMCQTPWGQSPQVGLLALSLGQGLPGGPQATMGLVSVGLPASSESAIMIKEEGDEHQKREEKWANQQG